MTRPQKTIAVMCSFIALAVVAEGILLALLAVKSGPRRPEQTHETYQTHLPRSESRESGESVSTGAAVAATALSLPVLALYFALGLLFYFIPTFIAFARGHCNRGAIFAVNLFFGLACGLGWFIALIWSLTEGRSHGDVIVNVRA